MHVNCRRSSSICKIERKEKEGKTRRYRNSSSDKSDLSPAIYCCDSTKRRRSKQESRMISEGFQIGEATNIWKHQITFRIHGVFSWSDQFVIIIARLIFLLSDKFPLSTNDIFLSIICSMEILLGINSVSK